MTVLLDLEDYYQLKGIFCNTWKTTVNLRDSPVRLGGLLSTLVTVLLDLKDYCQFKGLSCMTWKTIVNIWDCLVSLGGLLST